MPTYREEAVVLRTHKLGEADRIITLLTRREGKVRAVAKGVRRTSSKFGARLEPFSHVDLQLAQGRNLDTVTQAVSLHSWGEKLSADYRLWTTGQVMVETADRLVDAEREPALQQFLLLAGALRVLIEGTTDGPRDPSLILNSYLLRSLSVAGYAPSLRDCARCGLADTADYFSPSAGGVVCVRCRPPGSPRVEPVTVGLMSALLAGDWPLTRGAAPGTIRTVDGLVGAFVAWYLERGLRSMPILER